MMHVFRHGKTYGVVPPGAPFLLHFLRTVLALFYWYLLSRHLVRWGALSSCWLRISAELENEEGMVLSLWLVLNLSCDSYIASSAN